RDAGAFRAALASCDHAIHCLAWSREHRLDRAITPITHPAVEPVEQCGVLGPGAIADALHAAAHHDAANGQATHPTSPVSFRAAPAKPDGDQRISARIYGSGRPQSRAASTTIAM